MTSRTGLIVYLACVFALAVQTRGVYAADPVTVCLDKKYQAYAEAQREWQHESTRFAKEIAPEYSEIAERFKEEQIQRIRRREMAVSLLLQTRPDKVYISKPLHGWINLDKNLTSELAAESKNFAALQKAIEQQKQMPPHPDADKLRALLRDKVLQTPEFQSLLKGFREKVAGIEQIQCDAR